MNKVLMRERERERERERVHLLAVVKGVGGPVVVEAC